MAEIVFQVVAITGFFHVFSCMLVYYLEWHMRRQFTPLLSQDADRKGAQKEKGSPVVKSVVSPSAKKKADSKKTADGLPIHIFRTLLDDLATLVLNTIQLPRDERSITMATQPTELQSKAFELLEVRLN